MKYETAVIQLNEILTIDPNNSFAKRQHSWLMETGLQRQKDEEAAVQFEEKLKAGSKEKDLRESYLEVLRRLGRNARAEQIEKEIVRLKWNPN